MWLSSLTQWRRYGSCMRRRFLDQGVARVPIEVPSSTLCDHRRFSEASLRCGRRMDQVGAWRGRDWVSGGLSQERRRLAPCQLRVDLAELTTGPARCCFSSWSLRLFTNRSPIDRQLTVTMHGHLSAPPFCAECAVAHHTYYHWQQPRLLRRQTAFPRTTPSTVPNPLSIVGW